MCLGFVIAYAKAMFIWALAGATHLDASVPLTPEHPSTDSHQRQCGEHDAAPRLGSSLGNFSVNLAVLGHGYGGEANGNMQHCVHVNSHVMCLHPSGDLISDTIRNKGGWERALVRRFRHDVSRLGANGVVIDLGANLGVYGLLAAQMNHQVILVEALPLNIERLRESIRENHWGSDLVTLLQGAICCGGEDHFEMVMSYNVGGSRAQRVAVGSKPRHRTIPGLSLDDFLRFGLVPPGAEEDGLVMKMDLEGFECEAVLGGERFLRRFSHSLRAIYMEWGGYGQGRLPPQCSVGRMVDFLYELGFEPWTNVHLGTLMTGDWVESVTDRSFFWLPLRRANWHRWPWEVVWFPSE